MSDIRSTIDFKKLAAMVIENRRKLKACPKHFFPVGKRKLGEKMVCQRCGGEMPFGEAMAYIDGYAVDGRNPADIWPELEKKNPGA